MYVCVSTERTVISTKIISAELPQLCRKESYRKNIIKYNPQL